MSEQAVFDALKYRVEVDEDGTHRYYNNAGQLHRTNGPAVELHSGHKEWDTVLMGQLLNSRMGTSFGIRTVGYIEKMAPQWCIPTVCGAGILTVYDIQNIISGWY
jgi:hypothetical protein